ncbi:MAG: hypothetical protein K6T85_08120 [Gorillibacterium sp.]|nr:hypothetical protein [Gorillibacterium sp.]
MEVAAFFKEAFEGATKGFFLALWLIGSAIPIGYLTQVMHDRTHRKRRIRKLFESSSKPNTWAFRNFSSIRNLAIEMEFAGLKIHVELLATLMIFLFSVGLFGVNAAVYALHQEFATGAERFVHVNAWFLSVFVGLLLAGLPIFYVKFRVQKKRHRIALRMIILVQNLIGHYNSTLTIAEILAKSSSTMPVDVKSEWRRLVLSLHMQTTEEALHDFARRIDNKWADDLADLLIMGAHYGMDITDALHKLVAGMQTAKRNEEKRMAMITVYRIGTMVMVGFAFFVVLFNIYADRSNYRHYFLEQGGKVILTLSTAVMFASLLLVVHAGRKPF